MRETVRIQGHAAGAHFTGSADRRAARWIRTWTNELPCPSRLPSSPAVQCTRKESPSSTDVADAPTRLGCAADRLRPKERDSRTYPAASDPS